MKNARGKLENPMPAAMPCRLQLSQHWETCGTVGQHKTKYACIDEADESFEDTHGRVSEQELRRPHRRKRLEFIEYFHLVHKFIPMPEAVKIPDAKAAVEKEWQNWRTYWHGS